MNSDTLIDAIIHRGTVSSMTDSQAQVQLADNVSCGGCPAAKVCGGVDRKIITVLVPDGMKLHPGDRVEVSGTQRMHHKAIRLATLYPTIALIAVMVGVYLLTGEQGVAALAGVGTMALFFAILWMSRRRLATEFTFTLHRVIPSEK